MQETWVQSLGWEDPLEKGMATHSNRLAWRLPRTEESRGLQSMESQRVCYNWATNMFTYIMKITLVRMLCRAAEHRGSWLTRVVLSIDLNLFWHQEREVGYVKYFLYPRYSQMHFCCMSPSQLPARCNCPSCSSSRSSFSKGEPASGRCYRKFPKGSFLQENGYSWDSCNRAGPWLVPNGF